MGLELVVAREDGPLDLAAALQKLAAAGHACTVIMIDGALTPPGAPVPAGWRDVRLKTPAGTLTVRRRPDGLAVIAFGNADASLQAMQRAVAAALGG